MNVMTQLLCRWLLILAMLSLPGLRSALAQPSSAPARGTPESVLQDSVKRWVAVQQKVGAEQVELAPFDPRLRIQACDASLQIDQPFSSPETVRVRCTQPVWQLFARVQLRQGRLTQAAAGGTETAPARAVPVRSSQVVVAASVLPRGTVINETHVQLAEVDTPVVGSPAFEKVADVLHSEVLRDLRPGAPIRSQDVRPAVLVKRGQSVLLTVGASRGFQISARVEAMQDGRMGEQIQLRNRESGRVLTGVVRGPNAVEGL